MFHFSSEQLNGTGGPIPITNQDGVQVVAYFGDVTGTGGPFTLQDAVDVSSAAGGVPNLIAQTLPGFTAFANLDPVLIGDVALQGSVNSTDAGAMIQQVAGSAKVTLPYASIGLPVTPVGPDTTLSVPGALPVVPGSTMHAPVTIDPAGAEGRSGMLNAVLSLSYDPRVFDVSAIASKAKGAERLARVSVPLKSPAALRSASLLPPAIWDQAFEDLHQIAGNSQLPGGDSPAQRDALLDNGLAFLGQAAGPYSLAAVTDLEDSAGLEYQATEPDDLEKALACVYLKGDADI